MTPGPTAQRGRELLRRLQPAGLQTGVSLAPYTTFRIGGPADYFYCARTADELAMAVTVARDLGIPHFILGVGANILVGDGGFRGLVIRNRATRFEFTEGHRVRAESGAVVFPDLITACLARSLGGLHHYVGIPSSVGGALWQNLHFLAPDRSRTVFLAEVLDECDILTEAGERRTVGVDYLRFGYDYSILHDRADVVLTATFQLKPRPQAELRETVRENLRWRDDHHPDLWLYPCAGSIFKKIEGVGAGRLIDECGLKGHVHESGRAMIFHRHANIIVNLGGATAADVRDLITLVQGTVERRLGLRLEPEIVYVGEF